MREWLRGGAPPCQGGGRGFESRLALFCFLSAAQNVALFLYFNKFYVNNGPGKKYCCTKLADYVIFIT